jgi:hypothetical protein
MLKLTSKRRENLAKICVNAITVDLAGLVMPFALRPQESSVSIFYAGIGVAFVFTTFVFLLEK